ncbi:MAG TPA: hypothetical protein VHC69_12085 [Polyangiaceae bacterium]|nr:hypothetical protein [Polyangiaceae bacterium]
MAPFRDLFDRAARRVRVALGARRVLDAAVVGTAAAAVASVALAALGKPAWPALALALAGACYGAVTAKMRRFGDADVALFVDARLGSGEAVVSALSPVADEAVQEQLASVAARTLSSADRRAVVPRIFFVRHAVLPVALLVVAFAPRFVPAKRPPLKAERPAERVKASLEELRRVEALKDIAARTEAERARRSAIADKARALAERAAKGMAKRDALDALGKLRDSVEAERAENRTNDGARRAAARALAKAPDLHAAADALRRADLVAFDAEMDRLARTLEADARKTAIAALDEAREAAVARGDGELAGALDEQQRLLKRRAADSESLRELSRLLGDALPKDVERKLARLDRSSKESEAIAEAMASAVEGLTKEERERLARALAARASAMQGENQLSKAELVALANALKAQEAREALRRALKELADGEKSTESAGEEALAAASMAIGVAEARVAGNAGAGDDANGNGQGQGAGDTNGDTNGGTNRGGADGPHAGSTPEVAGSSFTSRASGSPLGGVPIGPAPGSSPPIAATLPAREHTAALSAARAGEVGAVERSNVPREYREQVRRYFAP